MPDHRSYDTKREEQELTPVLGTLSTLVSLFHSSNSNRRTDGNHPRNHERKE
jgi:hypothetical protein